MSASAGWHPDPAGRPGHYRWWDGSDWTRYLTTDPAAAPPERSAELDPAAGGAAGQPGDRGSRAAADPVAAGRSAAPSAGASDWSGQPRHAKPAGATATAQPITGRQQRDVPIRARRAMPAGYERPSGDSNRPTRTSTKVAFAGIGVAVAVTVTVLAVVVLGNPHEATLMPPEPVRSISEPASPASDPTAMPSFQPATRRFELNGLQLTMPASPYTLRQSAVAGFGGPGVDGDAVVHKDYDGKGNSWYATVMVGEVDGNLSGTDINQTADKIMSMAVSSFFSDAKITVKRERKSTVRKNIARPARIITADLHYSVPGLRSRYDRFSLLVVKGSSGGYMAFLSSRPNDADAKIKKAIQDAVDSLQVVR